MITHNTEKQRFERTENGLTAVVEYRQSENEIELTHTFVPPPLEGQGIAASLTRAALEYARAENLAGPADLFLCQSLHPPPPRVR